MRGGVTGRSRCGLRFLGAVVAGGLLVGASGCATTPRKVAKPARATAGQRNGAAAPAFEAGGACQLLDYEVIRQAIGASFSVAAAAQQGDTYTCLVQTRGVPFPDLAISVTATKADSKVFQDVLVPAGAARIEGLGKAGYSMVTVAAGAVGPGVQVGWLAGNQRLMALRLRLAPTATPADAAAAAPKLTELAKNIDFASS